MATHSIAPAISSLRLPSSAAPPRKTQDVLDSLKQRYDTLVQTEGGTSKSHPGEGDEH